MKLQGRTIVRDGLSLAAYTAGAAIVLVLLFTSVATLLGQEEFHHPELQWRTIETDHFFVHYHAGTERTARAVAKIAEEIYSPVTSLYRHQPDGKVSFVIKDYDDYSNGAAYFFDNKIEIWASSLDTDLRGTHNWLRNVITHEFTHIVQIQTSFKFGRRIPAFYLQWLGYESERRQDVLYGYPNTIVSYPLSGFVIPSWFAEGVAQVNRTELDYDFWDSHRDMILRSYVLDGNMLSWNEMAVFGKTSLGNESSYNAGFSFVTFLVEQYGDEVLEKISRNLGTFTEVTIDGAIERATGTDGRIIYEEWKEHLRQDYLRRTEGLRTSVVEGEKIGGVGFANLYPSFSPDGSRLAYLSNKEGDYFMNSSLYVIDLAGRQEKRVKEGVRSNFSWSPGGDTIYYAKHTRDNPFWSNYYDLFAFDVATGEERRITTGQRANAPAVSPDGRRLAFVSGNDGTLNLYAINTDGTGLLRLTSYASGEQVYNPVWSPDGTEILFDYSIKDGRDLRRVPSGGGTPEIFLATPDDERTPAFSVDGSAVYFASDRSGIFNIYRQDLATGHVDQMTNVLGGAFMPSVDASGRLAYSQYTSTGYKLALLEPRGGIPGPALYVRTPRRSGSAGEFASSAEASAGGGKDWQSLRSYDDARLPEYTDVAYNNTTTTLSVIPFLRVDNYNPKNKGFEIVKPGVYLYSYDMLDRYGFFASAAMNVKGERDLFFTFDYRGAVPGFFQLGMDPGLSLEAFNVTRDSKSSIALPLDTIPVDISYNLIEFDAVFRQKLITEALDAEYGYRHSRYTANISSFYLPEASVLVPATSILYFKGNDLFLNLTLDVSAPSRTQEINPVGRKIRLRYGYEFNDFDPTDEINDRGELVHSFRDVNYHRLELSLREARRLPGWRHTLSATARWGTIFGPPVDDFFDYYIGGLSGMKGYPFYSLGGNEFAMGNLTYRFPLWENIDLRFLQFSFDRLYGAVYFDAGTVWNTGSPGGQRFKRDLGFELRLESFSFYAYPTRIFFSATYGLDAFDRYVESRAATVRYGKEWQYHFGVLFGFDFD